MSLEQPLDISGPLRTSIIGNSNVTPLISTFEGEPAVFTRRPIPAAATYPLILIGPSISIGDMDGLKVRMPLPRRDLLVYGEQPDDYRAVEAIAFYLRQQFHRQKFAVDLTPDYQVLDIRATGPMPAPSDDQKLVGRAVLLQLKLRDLTT